MRLPVGARKPLILGLARGEVGKTALRVEGLSCGSLFQDISFDVRQGEVVGFYGLVGAGRTEIAETLFGLRTPSAGKIFLKDEELRIHSPIEAIRHGISLVPESRKEQGLVLGMNCRDNITLPQVSDLVAGPFVSDGAEVAIFDQYRDRLEIKTPSWRSAVGNLSGGNQQKIVVAREIERNPDLLLVGQPTRGVDIGAIEFIHKQIISLRDEGKAILLVSVELEEILALSDRIAVMFDGQIMGERMPEQTNEKELGLLMAGITDTSGEAA